MNRLRTSWLWAALAGVLAILLALSTLLSKKPSWRVQLSDGRIIEIERVTFGSYSQAGSYLSIVAAAINGLCAKLNTHLPPVGPLREMRSPTPTLMAWIHALDPITSKPADCGSIRVDLIDDQGVRYGGSCRCAGSGGTLNWAGYCFDVFPRAQRNLTLEITPWDTNRSARIVIPNPHKVAPAQWSGGSLPQIKTVGDLQIALTGLRLRTNGAAMDEWQTVTPFWEPAWELRQAGMPADGWEAPEWNAEDPLGNRSRFVGVNQPIVRFDAAFYPSITNLQATVLIGTSPPVALDALVSNVWWNLELPYGRQKIAVLGLFPSGSHIFSEGKYVPIPAPGMGSSPVGRSHGWDGWGRPITPGRFQSWHRHLTSVPTIYVRTPKLPGEVRLGVRIQDEQGRSWTTKAEPWADQEESAYLLEVPPDVKTVRAEIVLVKPVKAEFLVKTRVSNGG